MPKIPRSKDGRPYIVPPGGDKAVLYTRTSKFASTLDDGYGLDLWHQHLIAKGIADNTWTLSKIRQTYTEAEARGYDWNKMNGVCAQIRRLAGADEKAEYGDLVHELCERLDKGEPLGDYPAVVDADLMAYEYRTENLRHTHHEGFVVNDKWGIAGSFDKRTYIDNEVTPDGEPFNDFAIGDVKTGRIDGQDVKFSIQFTGYADSEFYECTHDVEGEPSKEQCNDNAGAHKRTPLEVNSKWAVLIHVPAQTGTCELYWVDLEKGRALGELAQQVRKDRRVRTFTPFVLWDDGVSTTATPSISGEGVVTTEEEEVA